MIYTQAELVGRTARVVSSAESITLEIYGIDAPALEQKWREFERVGECTVFQTYDWLKEWHRHIGARKQNLFPLIVLGSVNDQTCFLFPLAVEAISGIRRLIWLGVDHADYNAPLLSRHFRTHVPHGQFAVVWKQIIAKLQSIVQFDVVELDKMPVAIGSQENPFREMSVMVCEYSAHAATLVGSWEEFYHSKTKNPKSRETDRRKLRNLAKYGEVRFVEVTELDEIERTFEALVQQKRASYTRMGVTDVFDRPGAFDFYRAIVTNPRLSSIAHLTRVDSGDVPVATGLGLRWGSRYYLILHSYQEVFARFSPGTHHIHQLLQHAISERMRIFDFTIGDEQYKNHWSDIHSPLLRYYQSRTIRGKLVVAARLLRHQAVLCYKVLKRIGKRRFNEPG